ncbi:DUF3224 domain-containing protein [Candidatus Chloroploca sp. M-50]|uniref:DUF3224 domain-containing protein n=1 Tax=Candidatus Chloroploca mongolica TaxID=2528176 RepID=A0ABS4DCJ7_9CHLR|nr:DUF3224 domain-containing protein [Candidatus Chloroploca mongolica]MBP1467168.1 DUF3224 domain-containing protein [Candidatus Chloroploca mongolica]
MTLHAHGTFTVQLTPQPLADPTADSLLGRLAIAKEFQGDITGISHGEMLSARSAVDGSAGYVAIERFTGTLHGRRGSFVLQHSGTMTRGAQQLTISVVPDSGTDELEGLTGTMNLQIADGVHAYDFIFTQATSHDTPA